MLLNLRTRKVIVIRFNKIEISLLALFIILVFNLTSGHDKSHFQQAQEYDPLS
jgi:hypothetical protein